VLGDEQGGDEEPGDDEEDVDAEEPARQPRRPGMEHDDGENRYGPEPVHPRRIWESA